MEQARAVQGEQLFAALKVLERRCREDAAGMPSAAPDPDIWAGVLYAVGGGRFLSSLGDVEEILELPERVTRVPGARSWVRGIANNRGNLLPIFDLQEFLFDVPVARSPRNRILVVRQDGPCHGLLVSDVIGIRHFESSARVAEVPAFGERVDALIDGGYGRGEAVYPELNLQRLGVDARFNMAAA